MDEGDAFNDFMDRLADMGELKHEEGMRGDILESESLIRGHRMGRNSAENPKITGPLVDRIAKTLIYGNRRKSETDLRIGEIKKALSDFAKQAKMIGKKRNIRKGGIKFKKIEKLEIRENDSNLQRVRYAISRVGSFTDSAMISNKGKQNPRRIKK